MAAILVFFERATEHSHLHGRRFDIFDQAQQKIARLFAAALPVPQTREARGRAELQRSGLLGSGHVDCAPEAGLRPGLGVTQLGAAVSARPSASGAGPR